MAHLFDVRQSSHFARYLSTLDWKIERIGGINYFIKSFPLIGSVLKIQRPREIDFKEIETLARRYRIFQIILEPTLATNVHSSLIIDRGFKLSRNPYLPSKTLHLDLTKPFKFKKETRRAIRVGERSKIKEYSTPSEIKSFREAWKNCINFKRYVPPTEQLINLRKSFPHNYSIFLASHNGFGTIIGGAIFTRSSHNFAYYWQAFTNDEGRASLSQYALLYHGILWAKKCGCKIFDFEGIYDSRFPNKKWLGFTHFKRSFGGYEVEYPGCYTKFQLPI